MNPNQYTLTVFNVTDARDIAFTDLFSEILYHNNFHPRDCYHWLDNGELNVINVREKAKLTFQFTDCNDEPIYSCIRSTMIHPSMPVAE